MSKTNVWIWPARFTRGGEMQKILPCFSRAIAKLMPTDMATGSAGGTLTVKRSSALSISMILGTPIDN